MTEISSVDFLESFDTLYPADTVEWCPILEYHHVFVCGTYKLDEANKLKTGTINLFILEDQNKIKLIQSIPEDAVLDLKWNPHIVSGKILLAAALSGNHIRLYSLGEYLTH
jgi:diphthamide biosynthesis protein 7